MHQKELLKEKNLYTIEDLFHFIHDHCTYGWVNQKGEKREGTNDANTYSLQSPDAILKSCHGNCWDITELSRYFFTTMTSLHFETYYLFYDDNKGCPSHSILVFYQGNKVYWFEPMFFIREKDYSGIHCYQTLITLLQDFQKKFLEKCIIDKKIPSHYNEEHLYLYQYEQPSYHINGYQLREHINQSKQIFISTTR